jgi:preprotein translocase subunit SecE
MAQDKSDRTEDDERDDAPDVTPSGGSGAVALRKGETARSGFFHPYKSGQGYWTRVGTAIGAALLVAATVYFLYQTISTWEIFTVTNASGQVTRSTARIVIALTVVGLVISLLAWWLMNKPRNVEFLIATDGEMKKVNWTSRKDLIGATKVVIFFMLAIAIGLFAIDILFGYLFYYMGVLYSPPF